MNEIASLNVIDSSEQAIEAIQTATVDNVVILDLDETLFLRNSTEEYLSSIYPQLLGAAYLRLARVIRPWQWLSAPLSDKNNSKDWFLVLSATLLFPWTVLVWHYRAKRLAKAYWNHSLVNAIANNPNAQIIIATSGFRQIVIPLLKHLPIALAPRINLVKDQSNIVACDFWQGAKDRAAGKLQRLTEAIGETAIAQAIVITDSEQDIPLLAAARTPCLIKWPEAEYVPAMSNLYLPLFYAQRVKNPHKSHIIKRAAVGHWSVLVIAMSFLSPHPLVNMAGLLLLNLSHWSIYEIGYWENDVIGEKYEAKPKLSNNYTRYKDRLKLHTALPWYWAIGLAIPALLLLQASEQQGIITFAMALQMWPALLRNSGLWLCYLIAIRTTFWIYNRFNERSRIWIYPILQVQRLFGFTLILPINAVGATLLLSLATARWISYTVYRCGGDRTRMSLNLSCLWVFTMSFFALAIGSPNPATLLTWQTAVAFVYCTTKGIREASRLGISFDLVQPKS